MKDKKPMPRFMVIYSCGESGLESGYTELHKPLCRYCNKPTSMSLVSKQPITPEVIAARLEASTNNMMKNLEKALEMAHRVGPNILGEGKDTEAELLRIMAKAKKLVNNVQKMKLEGPRTK